MSSDHDAKKILLAIEDDATILELYEHAFKAAGYQTFIAHDGEEGLNLIKTINPDCVILDILMPKVNGIEVLKAIQSDGGTKNIPILVLTNYDTYRDEAMALGAREYLIKANLTLKDILDKVNELFTRNKNEKNSAN